jgi:hypothetical protein
MQESAPARAQDQATAQEPVQQARDRHHHHRRMR